MAGNLLEPLRGLLEYGTVDLITANLPYIPSGVIPHLMTDVRVYEPPLALDGGEDGLDLYRSLVPEAFKMLTLGGYLLMEIGPGQGAQIGKILENGWGYEIFEDLSGRERLVIAKRHYL